MVSIRDLLGFAGMQGVFKLATALWKEEALRHRRSKKTVCKNQKRPYLSRKPKPRIQRNIPRQRQTVLSFIIWLERRRSALLTIFLNNRMLLGFLPPSQECSRRAALTRADAEGATTTRTNENRVETDNEKRNGKPEHARVSQIRCYSSLG